MRDYHSYNAKNGYGLLLKQLKYWAKRHETAVKSNDTVTVDWIENMLTDINFHSECGLFRQGRYKEAIDNFKGDITMANYFRITAYHPAEDVSVIMDANGLCEAIWQFSAALVGKGFKILEADVDGKFNFGNMDRCQEVSDKILLRACGNGKPVYSGNTVTVNGMFYTPDAT